MGHEELSSHYKNNFSLVQHHKWNLSEIESMIPWERRVYIELLDLFLKEQEQKMRDMENERKAQMSTMLRRKM